MDQANDYQAWVGRSESADDTVTPTPVRALRALLDRADAPVSNGEPLPPLWHWLYFLPLRRQSQIGPDGHPRAAASCRRCRCRGACGPAAASRSMRRCTSATTLRRVSDDRKRRRQVRAAPAQLVFVTVRHELSCRGVLAVARGARHRLPRREPARRAAPPAPQRRARRRGVARARSTPDAVLLFRYSALTFNGHRIHYDRDYATSVEGYPGLVVHGPLIATLLLEGLHRNRPETTLASFEFKAQRATFDGPAFAVHGRPSDDGRSLRLWASDHDGWLTMDATATFK